MTVLATLVWAAGVLSACASLPEVEYSYYPAKSQALITVTQTLDCTTDKKAVIVVNTPSVTAVYFADVTKGPYRIKIKDVEGTFSPFTDSDISFSFYDDGRLKSINQSTTGQGETIIKSAVSLASALGGAAPPPPGQTLTICDKIDNWGKGKPVTLVYSGTIDLATKLGQSVPLAPAVTSRKLFADLKDDPSVPIMAVQVGAAPPTDNGAKYLGAETSADYVPLTLQSTASVVVTVKASGAAIWNAAVPVPLPQTYVLPIPKAALFGKQSFSLALSEAGVITSVEYGKNTGAASVLNAAGAAATAQAPETTAAKAADVKAQADLIAQQQRLARCQANPAQCQ